MHQIGLPYHWGVGGDAVVSGDAANDLLGVTLDPNVQIQESKAGLVRHPAGPPAARRRRCCRLVAGVPVTRGSRPPRRSNARVTDPRREG